MQVILYIVHSPPTGIAKLTFEGLPCSVDKLNLHKIELTRAIKSTVKFGVPIFAEVMNEYEEERIRNTFTGLGISEPKYHIVYGHEVESPEDLRKVIERSSKLPDRVLVSGYFKEDCCETAVTNMRTAFPDADIVVLKGDCALSSRLNSFYPEQEFPDKRARFKKTKCDLRVRTKRISRRLLVMGRV